MHRQIATTALAASMLATPALAQNFELSPTYGEITLQAGFADDPQTIAVTSGGNIDAESEIGGECYGYIADAPDYRLNYQAGSYPLLIAAMGSAAGHDVTLVISMPDGSWACDDDSFEDGDAAFLFENPPTGQYDIWVGDWEDGADATLVISETMAQKLLEN